MVLNVFSIVAGLLMIALTLNDVFQSVIVPRAVGRRYRLSAQLMRATWRLWPALAWRLYPKDGSRREDFIAAFAPLLLVTLIAMWSVFLALGYGALLYGMRDEFSPQIHAYATAVYFASTSLLTIGFGDIVPRGGWARFISMCAGASGLGVLSITTAFLFATFGAFQQREAFVVLVSARAGRPGSGVGLIAIHAYADLAGDVEKLMRDAQTWAAIVMETHLAYPILSFFRSSHEDESWIGTLGTLLDAATLMMTTLDMPCGEARFFYAIGRHCSRDLAHLYSVESVMDRTGGVHREEFERACDRLAAAGLKVRNRDEAWQHFATLRSTYAGHLNGLARFFDIPPLEWVGDRSLIPAPHAVAETVH